MEVQRLGLSDKLFERQKQFQNLCIQVLIDIEINTKIQKSLFSMQNSQINYCLKYFFLKWTIIYKASGWSKQHKLQTTKNPPQPNLWFKGNIWGQKKNHD